MPNNAARSETIRPDAGALQWDRIKNAEYSKSIERGIKVVTKKKRSTRSAFFSGFVDQR
jgi:hypothetical protein